MLSGSQIAEPEMQNRAPVRVLIVEDGADDRMVYRIMLTRRASFQLAVTLAATGEEGLEALRAGAFDCILLDHHLPDMTGLELLDQARLPDGRPPCPVVMVTGSHDESVAIEARRRGVGAVLLKDELDAGELRAAIERVIAVPTAPRAARSTVPPPPPPPAPAVSARGLSIDEARSGLAAAFGVNPASVEIIIHK
jgi:CheY-like chemotaxis protein